MWSGSISAVYVAPLVANKIGAPLLVLLSPAWCRVGRRRPTRCSKVRVGTRSDLDDSSIDRRSCNHDVHSALAVPTLTQECVSAEHPGRSDGSVVRCELATRGTLEVRPLLDGHRRRVGSDVTLTRLTDRQAGTVDVGGTEVPLLSRIAAPRRPRSLPAIDRAGVTEGRLSAGRRGRATPALRRVES